MKNYINKVIYNAYDNYTLLQFYNEYYKFCEFFYSLRCKNIMEIGTYLGGNFYVMCKLSDINGVKISLDNHIYPGQLEQMNAINLQEKIKSFSDKVVIVDGDSHLESTKKRIDEILNGEKLDFLFIDGDHTYEGVKQDFEMYKGFVKSGGYVAFHDINDTEFHRNANCYVDKLWQELIQKYEYIEFDSNSIAMGIGVVKVE